MLSAALDTPARAAAPVAFRWYAAATVLLALLAGGWALAAGGSHGTVGDARFWLLAALCLLGELLPIRLPRRTNFDEVTVSSAFAVAVLLSYGLVPAMATYAAASLLADGLDRNTPLKAGFNAAQYALALGAGAVVLELLGGPPPVSVTADLPAILLASGVFFAVNHGMAGAGAALLSGVDVPAYLSRDLPFHVWAAGFQLPLAPIVVAAADTGLVLVPLLFFPMLAIYLGGREAVVNEFRALHDSLTELPNRRLFGQRLEQALRAAGDGPLVVMFSDLDDFKAVNDSLGHHLGDLLLQEVARRLADAVPEEATVARLGGDEFAVLLPGASLERGREVADILLARLEEPIELDSFSLDIRASFGLAAYPEHGDHPAELMKHADVALYRAKATRAGAEVYAEARDERGFDSLALAEQLRQGIDRGELVLHYQPKLALQGGRPHGVEALVRWQHPHLGLIGPDGFISLAEQTNLIKPLTRWVLATALADCRGWRDRGLELQVAVNLSARSLLDRSLPGVISDLLAETRLPPSVLQVEVTESKVVADFGRAREVLRYLRGMGVWVAIDDFGTGFSSLGQLQQLPADEIKIDRSFVLTMASNPNDLAIVRSTIGLGRNLGLTITAEGVETPEVRDRLVALGCDYAQGYLFGAPVPAEASELAVRRELARLPADGGAEAARTGRFEPGGARRLAAVRPPSP